MCHVFLPPATKLGQVYVFTGVCDSVNRGVSASVHAGIHTPLEADTPPEQTLPWEQTPPGADTPPEQTHLGADTLGSRHPPRVDTPQSRHPPRADTPHRACWEIRSMRGWYASYWNAILSHMFFFQNTLSYSKKKRKEKIIFV